MSTPEQEPQPYGTPPPPPPADRTQQISGPGHGQPGPGYGQQSHPQQGHGQQFPGVGGGAMPAPPPWAQYAQPNGALGTMRPTGEGLGGIVALVISLVFGIVSPFLLSNEVGKLHERRGQAPPVTALTGLWFFPGIVILVGPFIWFVRTNNALNEYWRSQGVTRTSLV